MNFPCNFIIFQKIDELKKKQFLTKPINFQQKS